MVGFQAFFSDGGSLTSIGPSGSLAFGINDGDQVVGALPGSGRFGQHAFIYSDGVVTDLNDLIPPDSGFILEQAQAITNSGQIVGTGFSEVLNLTRPFLLTPDGGSAPHGHNIRSSPIDAALVQTALFAAHDPIVISESTGVASRSNVSWAPVLQEQERDAKPASPDSAGRLSPAAVNRQAADRLFTLIASDKLILSECPKILDAWVFE